MPNYNLVKGSCQYGFFKSRAKVQVFGGAFGNGKSTGLIVKALSLVRDYPGSLGLMARATYPKLNDTLRKDFLIWCPQQWIRKKPTESDNSCYMANSTTIHFRYVAQRGKSSSDGSTTSNLLSGWYDWIIIDQIEDPEIVHKDFLDLVGRLRGNTQYRPPEGVDDNTMPSTGPRWLMIGCNPTRNWFYQEVIRPYQIFKQKGIRTDKLIVDEETKEPLVELYESDIYANRANLDPDYIRTMEGVYKGQMRDRYVLGKWVAFEGLVHPFFDVSKHTVSREQARAHLQQCVARHVVPRVIEGYDFGLSSPTVYLLGVVDDFGRVIVLDGFSRADFSYELHATAIHEVRARWLDFFTVRDPILGDPAIYRKQVIAKRDTGDTVEQLLSAYNLRFVPANNEILPGIAKVNSYLADRQGVSHILTGEDPAPLLYFVDDLQFIQEEFTSYYWKKNPQGVQIDEPVDNNDHSPNTVKYMLSRLPEASRVVLPKNQLPPQWMFWQEMERDEYGQALR